MPPNTDPDTEFNADELVAPEWLNQDFFTKVLQTSEKSKNIEVKNVKLTPGTGKGDHYASIMFRALVDYQQAGADKVKSLLIKTMPYTDGAKKDMLSESKLFETEIGMYTVVLPEFEKILRAIDDETILKAPVLYHAMQPRQLIVFEDIVPLGYNVLRERELHVAEVKAVFLKLAKWHAISYKINLEQPRFFEQYRYGLLTMPSMVNAISDGITLFIELLHSVPSLEKYAPYFEAMEAGFVEKCVASYKEYSENPQKSAYYVLCHGDFHGKNLMLKSNATSGIMEDVMLLDFQLCYVGSIAKDLIYAVYMMLDAEMRAKHRAELFHYYFSNFQETLRKIGFKGRIPKMTEFSGEIMRNKHFEILLLTSFLPSWLGMRAGEADFDQIFTSVEFRRKLFRNPVYIEELQTILPTLLYLGYLEN